MTTTEPLFVIKYLGNVKDKVIDNKHVWACAASEKETTVFLIIGAVEARLKARAIKALGADWKQHGEIVSINYYPMGATIKVSIEANT